MKYRKLPIVIDAFQIGVDDMPDWFRKKVKSSEVRLDWLTYVGDDTSERFRTSCDIMTLEGIMHGDYGDYIIQGVNGEIYPCKPDIFAKTYEAAE